MKFEELPQPLQNWLGETEGFGIRHERLIEDVRVLGPKRMLDWLAEAYAIGQKNPPPAVIAEPREPIESDRYGGVRGSV